MKLNYKKVFHCFHGTTKESFRYIINEQKFTFRARSDHWLGNGVYFFLDDYDKAYWWSKLTARNERRIKKGKFTPIVAYIEAKTDIDKVLDLNSEQGQKMLSEFHEALIANNLAFDYEAVDSDVDEDQIKIMSRCYIMNLLAEVAKLDASCYMFPNNDSYHLEGIGDYGIMTNKGNQFCVYNQDILDFSTLIEV